MSSANTLASPDEIHAYLVGQLGMGLRRIGMMGGEVSIRILLDHLLFVERRPEAWEEERRTLETRGAWSATGLTHAFDEFLPRDDGYGMASLYAEFARRQGWLTDDRLLTGEEYTRLRATVEGWAASDRTWSDVTGRYGQPSVLIGGTNPYFGKVLGYFTEDVGQPMVFFHLWNGTDGPDAPWPPEREEPALLAVRLGDVPVAEAFTFTPEGLRRRPLPCSGQSGRSRW
ncbi:hypothetical protein [Streptomyces sp. NPDC048623]|uniref:hypothetical protein n=1 Tax=Streptomyces sp. NPDC048623 TaxID=3155761 RepID=UPI003417115C